MHGYVKRILTKKVERKLKNTPVVAILGPRQCGKSTLAKAIISNIKNSVYLDLERPSDINKLRDPEAFFSLNSGNLVCIDEIQRKPELFPVLRSVVDENQKNGQILALGSASPDLIKQTSETLAGRISYLELTPFLISENNIGNDIKTVRKLWLKGGFPRSYFIKDNVESFEWRLDFIKTFLERDIPMLGFKIPAKKLERFWMMCAHSHANILNSSKLGESLGLSHHTIRSYIDILEQTFVLRVLLPYVTNLKKRMIKSPKIYIRDSGILHALHRIESNNDLLGHPIYGSSWEGFAIENIISSLPDWNASFYRTANGAEIDLILEKGTRRIAVECKVSVAPNLSKGFWNAINDLQIDDCWVIAPVKEMYPIKEKIKVAPIDQFIKMIN